MAAEVVKENFAVINADDFYGREAYVTIVDYLHNLDVNSYDNAMVGYLLKNTLSDHGYVSRGQCSSDTNGFLIDVVERTRIQREKNGIFFDDSERGKLPLEENTLVSMNFWGFTPMFFKQLELDFKAFLMAHKTELKAEFYIPSVVNHMINSKIGNTKVLQSEASWFGVTYQEDKPVVVDNIKQLIEQGVYPKALWS